MKTETELIPVSNNSELISNLVLNGDISKMSNEMKVQYYNQLCHSLNLNPVTKPFQIIAFQGKTILYATKDCTEQLRKINKVSIVELNQDLKEGLCISKCKVQDKDNRYDIATGVVNISGLKGGDLANAIMKSETKAKRRATLSICGLGILDESELDTMPTYTTSDITQVTTEPEVNLFKDKLLNYLPTITDAGKLEKDYNDAKNRKQYSELSETDKADIDKTYIELMNKFPVKETPHPLTAPEEITLIRKSTVDNMMNKISVDDILPGEVEEVEIKSFVTDTIADLQKCKTVTGLNTKLKEVRNLAAYMFLDDSDKNKITEFSKTKKSELNEKK